MGSLMPASRPALLLFAPNRSTTSGKQKHVSFVLTAPARSRDARPNRRPSGKAEKVSMERGNGEVMPLPCCVILPRVSEPAPSAPRSVGRLPCAIDAVWFDSEKLLGKEGRKGVPTEVDSSSKVIATTLGREGERKGEGRTRSWKGQREQS